MDHNLLGNPDYDFTISPVPKYLGQERPYSNSSYSTNDFHCPNRRNQGTLTNGSTGVGVAVPANSSLEFNGSSGLLNETPPYHSTSQLLLSPPDSTSGSASASGQPTSSVLFSTLPKPFPSNAGQADHFSSAPSSVLSGHWTGTSMTAMDRPRFQPLSPPMNNYPSGSGIAPLNVIGSRPMVERLSNAYHSNGQSISPAIFHNQPRYQSAFLPRNSTGNSVSGQDHPFTGHMSPAFHDNTNRTPPVGPPFGDTSVHYQVINAHNQTLIPDISASIQKGFFQVEQKWTCYRRNYFAVACSFTLKGSVLSAPFYLDRGGQRELIQNFAVSISAKTASVGSGESEERGLVQHTPKRDKATESVPKRQNLNPTPHHSSGNNGLFHSAASGYTGNQHLSSALMTTYNGFDPVMPQATSPAPTNHTFERIQFQKATANNGKRRAQQQYFLVVVNLSVSLSRAHGEESWVVIASKQSDPMVVRGRSPGHYKDNGRRDSETSMDPGRGSGPGDGSSGPLPLPPYGGHGSGHSAMDWQSTHRPTGPYGGGSYRRAMKDDFSHAESLMGPHLEAELSFDETRTAKSSCTFSTEQSVLTPLSEESDEPLFTLDHHLEGRKRLFEEEEDDDDQLRYHGAPFPNSSSSLADFSTGPWSKILSASS